MNYQVSKMRLTLKRFLQALFLAVLFSFSTLAVIRTLATNSNANYNFTAAVPDAVQPSNAEQPWMKTLVDFWPDRSLRSVAEESFAINSLPQQQSAEAHPVARDVVEVDAVAEVALPVTTQSPATATAKTHTDLDDIFISVKTTKNFHATRLDVIIKTWFTLARDQVF